ncbi:Lactobacillus shifted protein [Penicillium oxalicum]|uniref:Lactobacillus shifted protein n=1 Tax=Penicillium oxalicum TaxID=69781 RepID=UPI0020B87915|nr:Lactobacillus shifted protein [Penicillium oxalicum]KAI2793475.1 Lactobacillus shifted protein [Penicillium oxalicum]
MIVPRFENRMQANDPSPPVVKPNVSETNAHVLTDRHEKWDGLMVEEPAKAERLRSLQSPNELPLGLLASSLASRPWSALASNRPLWRPRANTFTWKLLQPRPMAAIELIHKQPVRWTKSRVVSCDGGGGPLGHPKVFINTDKPEMSLAATAAFPLLTSTIVPTSSLFRH